MLEATDPLHELFSLFYPEYFERRKEFVESKCRFVQYTSAQSAMNIIKDKKVWLRNTQCMNDFSEIKHGLKCLEEALKQDDQIHLFTNNLENYFPGIRKKFFNSFNPLVSKILENSYICCVSEHPPEEDDYGRLSMWRAYGGDNSVAIVLNTDPFFIDSDAFQAYTAPVIYKDNSAFPDTLRKIAENIDKNSALIKSQEENTIIDMLIRAFKLYALCVKHPGFREEQEWRIVYNPTLSRSKHVEMVIEPVYGVPQTIVKLPLKNIPEENFYGATIPDFIEKIIIGPNDHQLILGQAFCELLYEAGSHNPEKKIIFSGIPLR